MVTGSGTVICGLAQPDRALRRGSSSLSPVCKLSHIYVLRRTRDLLPPKTLVIRAVLLAIVVTAVQVTAWTQSTETPADTETARNFTVPLESPPPAMLTQPATAVPTPSLPCQMKTQPASFLVGPGNLPDAPSAYAPLSRDCKFKLVLRQTYSPYTFASAAFDSIWGQMWGQWPQYGGGMQGWGKRMGATLADVESRRFIQNFVLASLLHEDPRYFFSGKSGLVPRAWYAATRVLVTRDDYGRNVFNQSEFLGVSFTSSLQNAYYPRPDRTLGGTINRFAETLSGDATTNILHEFTPDLKRLFHQRCPQGIQRFEARIPIPENVKP